MATSDTKSTGRSCGECLFKDVEIVALDERGICPKCGTDYGPEAPRATVPALWYDYTAQAWVENGKYKQCGHRQPFRAPCFACLHAGEYAPVEHYTGTGPGARV